MQNIGFSSAAEADLEAIGGYIAQDSATRALNLLLQNYGNNVTRSQQGRLHIAHGLKSDTHGSTGTIGTTPR